MLHLRHLPTEQLLAAAVRGLLLAGIFVLPLGPRLAAVTSSAWQLGFFNAYAVGWLTPTLLFWLAGVAGWLLLRGAYPATTTPLPLIFGLPALAAAIAAPFAADWSLALFATTTTLLLAGVATAIASGFLAERLVVYTLATSASLQALLAISQVATGHALGLGAIGESSFTAATFNVAKVVLPSGDVLVRGLGTTAHANLLGGLLTLVLLLWAVQSAAKTETATSGTLRRHFLAGWARWHARLVAAVASLRRYSQQIITALLVAGLLATFSRAAVLAAILGLLVLLASHWRRYISVAVVAMSISLIGIALTWPAAATRLPEAVSVGLNRSQLLTAALPTIATHPLGMGVGQAAAVVAAAHPQLPAYAWQPPHVFWAVVALEQGWLAALAWLVVLGYLAWRAVRTHCPAALAILTACGTLMLFDHYLATNPAGQALLWVVMGVAWRMVLAVKISPPLRGDPL